MGPIGVKSHLAPFLPGHPLVPQNGQFDGAVSGTPVRPKFFSKLNIKDFSGDQVAFWPLLGPTFV